MPKLIQSWQMVVKKFTDKSVSSREKRQSHAFLERVGNEAKPPRYWISAIMSFYTKSKILIWLLRPIRIAKSLPYSGYQKSNPLSGARRTFCNPQICAKQCATSEHFHKVSAITHKIASMKRNMSVTNDHQKPLSPRRLWAALPFRRILFLVF